MTRKEKIIYAGLILLIIAGWFTKNWFGGFVTGSAFSTILLHIIGSRVAKKAAARIDKRVKDILIEED